MIFLSIWCQQLLKNMAWRSRYDRLWIKDVYASLKETFTRSFVFTTYFCVYCICSVGPCLNLCALHYMVYHTKLHVHVCIIMFLLLYSWCSQAIQRNQWTLMNFLLFYLIKKIPGISYILPDDMSSSATSEPLWFFVSYMATFA